MSKIYSLISDYSSKKLKEIVEQQNSAYSKIFIDYAKDELIRRGENFTFNRQLEIEINSMEDENLKSLVENEWNNFHLEYIEIARKEYLKRGFINDTLEEDFLIKDKKNKYPALLGIANYYHILAWINGIVFLGLFIYFFFILDHLEYSFLFLFIGIFSIIICLSASESIKIFIDIEKNTRRASK